MASLSTHVLDTSSGRPAAGLRIALESADGSLLAEGVTDDDGRIGDLAADLKVVLRATVAELENPRYDAPMRALATEILHDPALHDAWRERIDGPLTRIRVERLRSAQAAGQLPGDLDLALAIDLVWGPFFHRWLQGSGPLSEAYADAVVDAALAGLR